MTPLERAALNHAKAELTYRRSPQAAVDVRDSEARRAAADRKTGHTPQCTLMKCSNDCRNHK